MKRDSVDFSRRFVPLQINNHEYRTRKIVTVEEQAEIEKVFLIKDPYIVELLLAYIICHFITGDPVWITIVAAPVVASRSSST